MLICQPRSDAEWDKDQGIQILNTKDSNPKHKGFKSLSVKSSRNRARKKELNSRHKDSNLLFRKVKDPNPQKNDSNPFLLK